MDPYVTLSELLAALGKNDEQEAIACADNLRQWLARGGFVPKLDRSALYLLLENLINQLRKE